MKFSKLLKLLKLKHDCKEHAILHDSNMKDCIIFSDKYYKCKKCNKTWMVKK